MKASDCQTKGFLKTTEVEMGKVRILERMAGHWQWVGLYREQGTVTSVSPGNPACSSPTLHTSYSRWLSQGDESKSGHWSKRLSLRVTLYSTHSSTSSTCYASASAHLTSSQMPQRICCKSKAVTTAIVKEALTFAIYNFYNSKIIKQRKESALLLRS